MARQLDSPKHIMIPDDPNPHALPEEPTEEFLPDEPTEVADLTVRRAIEPLAPAPPIEPCKLEQIRGPGAPNTFVIRSEDVVIGRSSTADIQIECADLSRHHMRLRIIDGVHHCEDQDSKNGLYLNGVRAHSATLIDGDLIQLGEVLLIFRAGR